MLKEFIASDMINVRHNIDNYNAPSVVPGTFAGSSMIRTTAIHTTCLTKKTTKKGSKMRASFGEVASKFNRLGENKTGMNNGIFLSSVMLFEAICRTSENKTLDLSVGNARQKYLELFGEQLNSASLSRHNAVLVKLGLIKLVDSPQDRRQKNITLTTVGHKYKSMFIDTNKRKEAI